LAETPVLLSQEMDAIKRHFSSRIAEIDTLFDINEQDNALRKGIDRIIRRVDECIESGKTYLVLTDERLDETHVAIPMILAVSAVQSQLVRNKLRKRASILVRTTECMDVHCAAVLIGVGATVINPYLAEQTIIDRYKRGLFSASPSRGEADAR